MFFFLLTISGLFFFLRENHTDCDPFSIAILSQIFS